MKNRMNTAELPDIIFLVGPCYMVSIDGLFKGLYQKRKIGTVWTIE